MRRAARALIATTLLAAGTVMFTATPADAGVGLNVEVDVPADPDRSAAVFEFEITLPAPECADDLTLTVEDGEEEPVDATIDDDAHTITFGPDVPGGSYFLQAFCTTQGGEVDHSAQADMLFARGIVDKVVEGEAPAAATFTVLAACDGESGEGDDSFDVELQFEATGGSDVFYVYNSQDCVVTESATGGADDVDVSGSFGFAAPADETVTVTNTFGAAPPTEPTPEPEPPAAQPAAVVPTFTG